MLTPNQKEKIYALLDEGLDTKDIAKKLRVPVPSVAACRANWTMRNQPKYFEVQGTFIIEASTRENAVAAVRRSRVPHTRVLSENVTTSRLSASDVSELID